MSRFTYDFHVHSCLSPCGDADNTPNNLAGMAFLNGIRIMALTDHNSSRNCPAFFEAAKRYGVIPIAGMELTTAEDIHVVCLFETLAEALAFNDEVDERRIRVRNREDIFGEQLILDGEDNVVGKEEDLLINATTISLDEAPQLVCKHGGVCYPAHIDRAANGAIEILGDFPHYVGFGMAELNDRSNEDAYVRKYGLEGIRLLSGSDAHYLHQLRDVGDNDWIEIDGDPKGEEMVRKGLFCDLRSCQSKG
ncbi:MAG: PHP domain-containing protein [Coriobacteriales bacterium]|nr:PHP domain-containing protein [Coriobacteriales bacterium]